MVEATKMELTSNNVAAEKRQELKRCLGQLFPEVLADGAIDFNQLIGSGLQPDQRKVMV